MKNKKVVCIVGPTSSGKTALSIALAKAYDGEIISADSRQVYQGLDLGSGKVTKEEMAGIPHYLLDVADPKETFTASEFARLGKRALNEIFDKEKLPIVTGGTGFYIDVLLGIITPAEVPPNETLRRELETKTITELQQLLQEKDPERFETIDTHNPRRLIRALEIAEELGKNPESKSESPYTILWIGLTVPSEELHKKIRMRIMHRFEQGMLEEAQRLHEEGLSY